MEICSQNNGSADLETVINKLRRISILLGDWFVAVCFVAWSKFLRVCYQRGFFLQMQPLCTDLERNTRSKEKSGWSHVLKLINNNDSTSAMKTWQKLRTLGDDHISIFLRADHCASLCSAPNRSFNSQICH